MQLIRKLTAKFLQLLIDLEKYRLHAFLFIYFSGCLLFSFLFIGFLLFIILTLFDMVMNLMEIGQSI